MAKGNKKTKQKEDVVYRERERARDERKIDRHQLLYALVENETGFLVFLLFFYVGVFKCLLFLSFVFF
jgi:hypothetical protein